ncbi:MAG: hypothetical protein JWM57_1445 [Phycisphaerales bacterium]|nr:hypothetical protein [Phycisphaerales bacterium]
MLRTHALGFILAIVAGITFGQAATPSTAPSGDGVGLYNLPGQPPYLLAHYMAWYGTSWSKNHRLETASAPKAETWTHWKYAGKGPPHDPDQKLADGHRDIASVVYPLIGAYDSGSPAVVRYHLEAMRAVGISGITFLWYGPGSLTDQHLPLLLKEADRLGMRVAITYEEKVNFPPYRQPANRAEIVKMATADLAYICRTYGDHPAYLRRRGLPVIAQFNGYGKDETLGNHILSAAEWEQVFHTLPRKVAYIRQNLDEAYHPLVAGAYVWWNEGDWPMRFAKRAAELRDARQLGFFMSMVCPGFNDTGVWGWGPGPRVSHDYGMKVLRTTEDHALVDQPELVQLVTWNDFNESTCFEPTVQHRFEFLEELGRWWSRSTHRQVDLEGLPRAFADYRQNCSPTERAEIPAAR